MRNSELNRKRNLINQAKYLRKTHTEIIKSTKKIKNARMRRGLYKPFYEELTVLLNYANLKYEDKNNIYCKWVGKIKQGNSINYDGEIYNKNELIEKVEITCPLRSRIDKNNAIQLNERGYTDVEVGNLEEVLENNNIRVLETVNKKNSKPTYDNSITLVIWMEDMAHYFSGNVLCERKIDELVSNLKTIDYKFKEVYLVINVFEEIRLIEI